LILRLSQRCTTRTHQNKLHGRIIHRIAALLEFGSELRIKN
jgi:hypothetical protein